MGSCSAKLDYLFSLPPSSGTFSTYSWVFIMKDEWLGATCFKSHKMLRFVAKAILNLKLSTGQVKPSEYWPGGTGVLKVKL